MKKTIPLTTLGTVLLISVSALAADKVVVVPLNSNSAAGTDGQLQFNDDGREAGAELYYDKEFNILSTDADILVRGDEGYGVGLSFYNSSSADESYGSILNVNPVDSFASIRTYTKRLVLMGKVSVNDSNSLATLDVEGYAKLKSYSSAPVSCTTGLRGTLVMNDDYDLCVCRPVLLGSGFKLVRDPGTNCW